MTLAKSGLFSLLFMLASLPVLAQETVCIQCHGGQPGRLGEPVKLWQESIHAANGISCHDCHGGDPTDFANAMSPAKGFLGVPKNDSIPEFCGRCHVGVKEDYLQSAHGLALGSGGPQCVTCHGNHRVVAASPELINREDCSRCHSYGRAEEIKSAVAATDGRIGEMEQRLARLHRLGIDVEKMKGEIFSLRNEFHRLFHSVDVEKVRSRTDDFQHQLDKVGGHVAGVEEELARRKFWGGIVVALLVAGSLLALLVYRTYRDEE